MQQRMQNACIIDNKKLCTKCQETKPIDQFSKRKRNISGYVCWCKSCSKLYYNSNRSEFLAQKRQFWEDNKESMKFRNRSQYIVHKQKRMLDSARYRAKKTKVAFDITAADIAIPTHCPILGMELVISNLTSQPNSPSLDRIIPSNGYVKNNIIVISQKANQIKNSANVNELRLVYEFYKKLIGE